MTAQLRRYVDRSDGAASHGRGSGRDDRRKHAPKWPGHRPRPTGGEPIYGKPTFKNVVNEKGELE